MDLKCLKCVHQFTDVSDIYATSCGHLFHCKCLMDWLDRLQTCPHCFLKQEKQNAIKIYVTSTDVEQESPQKLKIKVRCLNNELKLKEGEVNNLKDTNRRLKLLKKTLRDELGKLLKDNEAKRAAIQFNRMAIDYHTKICKVKEKYGSEVAHLREHLANLQSLDEILNGPETEIDDVLARCKLSEEALSACVNILVEGLEISDKDNENIDDNLACFQEEMSGLEEELESLKGTRASLIQELYNDVDCGVLAEIKKSIICLIQNQRCEDLSNIFPDTKLSHETDIFEESPLETSSLGHLDEDSPAKSLTAYSETCDSYQTSSSVRSPVLMESSPEQIIPPLPNSALQKKCKDLVKNACRNPMQYLTSGKVELLDSDDEESKENVNSRGQMKHLSTKFVDRKNKALVKKKHVSAGARAVMKKSKLATVNTSLNNSILDLMCSVNKR